MIIPAIPMKDAADKYSPEIADAFQPTETDRPATKKSPAVFDFPADQNPIATVNATVTREKIRIQGSACVREWSNPLPPALCAKKPIICAPPRFLLFPIVLI